jgi:ABC-type transport system involved in multi-copper enzyme maturation permease subunit
MAIMVVGTWLFLVMRSEPPKELAKAIFWVLTGGAVLFALVSGPRSTADCISEEKREGTLGLLFLTDLKGYDIVLGKLVACSLNVFYSVAAMLPMLAIPLLMGGGITLSEFARMALVTVNTLFFSLTLGICVSAMSRSAQKAAAVTSILIVFFAVGLPACGGLIAAAGKNQRINPVFLAPSVWFSYYLAFDAAYKASKMWFWGSIAVVQGSSWLCLILASLITPHSWRDQDASHNSLGWREHWLSWSYGGPNARAALRRRLLQENPVLWLMARIRSKPAVVWIFLGLCACGWVGGWFKFRREWLNEFVYVTTAILVNLVLRYWFAGEASRSLAENRKAGVLELLLSTPLKVEDILSGQWLALKRQFLGPLLAVLLVECLFTSAVIGRAAPDEERLFWLILWTAGMFMLVADLVALYWVGMWQGLTARNAVRAAGGSLARVLVVPWIGYGAVLLLIVLSERHPNPSWKFFMALWFGLGLGVDVAFGAWARQKLLTEFRLAAQQRYDSKGEFWTRWLRSLKPHVSGGPSPTLDPQAKS